MKLKLLCLIFLLCLFQAFAINYIGPSGIQQVTITLDAGVLTNSATINPISSTGFLLFNGSTTSTTTNNSVAQIAVNMPNASTIQAFRMGSQTQSVINIVAIDATTNLVKTVQFGLIPLNGATNIGSANLVTTVNTNNSAIVYLGCNKSDVSNLTPRRDLFGLTFTATNATARSAVNQGALNTNNIAFCVIEFNSNALKQNVQTFATVWGNVTNVTTHTITSVDPNNAFTIFSGQNTTEQNNTSVGRQRGSITSATNFTINCNTASNTTNTFYHSIVELNPGIISSVQRGTINLASVTTNTATISLVTPSQTFVNYVGNSETSNINYTMVNSRIKLINPTTVRAINTNTTANNINSFEVLQFIGYTSTSGLFQEGF